MLDKILFHRYFISIYFILYTSNGRTYGILFKYTICSTVQGVLLPHANPDTIAIVTICSYRACGLINKLAEMHTLQMQRLHN